MAIIVGVGLAVHEAWKTVSNIFHSRGNKMRPDPNAAGPHTTIKVDPTTGKITGYQEWGQSDPRDPVPLRPGRRYDSEGAAHWNKAVGKDVPTPHVHDPDTPGILNLQPIGSKAKAYQVKQVRAVILKYGLASHAEE